ncbi:hypothetical protein B0H10DRAFT_2218772 [Mycena sp. CBHHK59/15]|nr:hypothetical protein B0H10DRAFT_2218772 [Mycena sp. CBHHK59/15]
MSRETESRHPAPKQSATFASPPTAGPEIIVHNPTAATSSTETQLVILLSESRREAESLREELAAVRKKADSDQRLLNSFLDSSGQLRQSDIPFPASPDLHFFHERLAVAEAALEEAEAQNRIVAANWLQVDRYLSAVQHQAADSRAAFSRILEQDDGLLVLPQQSLPAMGREIPLKEYLSGSGSKPFVKPSHRSRPDPASTRSQRIHDLVRAPPLLTHPHPTSPPTRFRSSQNGDHRQDSVDFSVDPPPYKRSKISRRESELEKVSESQSLRDIRAHPAQSISRSSGGTSSHMQIHNIDHQRIPQRLIPPQLLSSGRPRRQTPPPADRPRRDASRSPHSSGTVRIHDITNSNPPIQIIQHRHPAPPPRPAPPQAPQLIEETPAERPHQFQHRFPVANAGNSLGRGYNPRHHVRPGAYETMVFALEPTAEGGDGNGNLHEK